MRDIPRSQTAHQSTTRTHQVQARPFYSNCTVPSSIISIILEMWKRSIYPTGMDPNLVVRALSALAHESRLAIFRTLVVAGPDGMSAGEIAQQLSLAPSSLSFHLKDLSHADLVKARQEGRYIYYSANFDAMNGLVGFPTENCCAGAACAASSPPACCGDES